MLGQDSFSHYLELSFAMTCDILINEWPNWVWFTELHDNLLYCQYMSDHVTGVVHTHIHTTIMQPTSGALPIFADWLYDKTSGHWFDVWLFVLSGHLKNYCRIRIAINKNSHTIYKHSKHDK